MARTKKQGWKPVAATIPGELVDAIRLIAKIQMRDTGEVLDELLRKAGVLDMQRDLLQERLSVLTGEEEGEACPGLPHEDSDLFQDDPEPPRMDDSASHRAFAEMVFVELDRTNRLCQLEAGLKAQALSPTPKEIDGWRRTKHIPSEYHQAILRYLDEPFSNHGNVKSFPRKKGVA